VLRTLKAGQTEIARRKGNMVIMGSVAGYCATPGNSPYCMSKFALRGLARSITPELARAGVRVIERFAPWILRAAARRMAAGGRGHRPEVGTH
jgi:short-subunit dehydrogenase